MLMPSGPSASKLSQETGVNQPTLSRWLREATTLESVTKRRKRPTPQTRLLEQKRPEDRSPDEKLRLVLDASALPESDLGEFLRRHGLHEADLAAWRETALAALGGGAPTSSRTGEAKRVRELEKELRRKDKALAETAALLVLQKKVRAIWGDGDEDTKPGSDE
jgi:DNA-binding transcriptional ArsR family regulator